VRGAGIASLRYVGLAADWFLAVLCFGLHMSVRAKKYIKTIDQKFT